MPRARVEPEGLPAGTLTFRVGDKHKAILDKMVAEDPARTRGAIVRAALEEYLERHADQPAGAA